MRALIPFDPDADVGELSLDEKRRLLSRLADSPDRYTPYRVLWVKVIIRAAYDYALWKASPDFRLRKYALDAEKWLFDPSTLVNSFENICFLFKLPADKLREWARNLTREQVKKFEFLERQGRDPLMLALDGKLTGTGDGEDR